MGEVYASRCRTAPVVLARTPSAAFRGPPSSAPGLASEHRKEDVMHDAEHRDPHHPRINFAEQQRRPPAPQENARSHPRGRIWPTLPPVLRRGPWRRIRAPDER